jgi:hypothetical protein
MLSIQMHYLHAYFLKQSLQVQSDRTAGEGKSTDNIPSQFVPM